MPAEFTFSPVLGGESPGLLEALAEPRPVSSGARTALERVRAAQAAEEQRLLAIAADPSTRYLFEEAQRMNSRYGGSNLTPEAKQGINRHMEMERQAASRQEWLKALGRQ